MYDKESLDLESATSRGSTIRNNNVLVVGPRNVPYLGINRLDTIRSIHEPIRPQARIPGDFRTLSLHVTQSLSEQKAALAKKKGTAIDDVSALDWHLLEHDEVCRRLGVAPSTGLDAAQATRRLASDGKNRITPPRTNWPLKIMRYFLGGFGSLLIVASILCFIAWKPLGEPAPSAANLAFAVVLFLVVVL
ncbi:hypothetical protein JCM8547_006437 [Rhodosporidiobolus lusitaniae]